MALVFEKLLEELKKADADFSVASSGPQSDPVIDALSRTIGVAFPPDYREFASRFGAMSVDLKLSVNGHPWRDTFHVYGLAGTGETRQFDLKAAAKHRFYETGDSGYDLELNILSHGMLEKAGTVSGEARRKVLATRGAVPFLFDRPDVGLGDSFWEGICFLPDGALMDCHRGALSPLERTFDESIGARLVNMAAMFVQHGRVPARGLFAEAAKIAFAPSEPRRPSELDSLGPEYVETAQRIHAQSEKTRRGLRLGRFLEASLRGGPEVEEEMERLRASAVRPGDAKSPSRESVFSEETLVNFFAERERRRQNEDPAFAAVRERIRNIETKVRRRHREADLADLKERLKASAAVNSKSKRPTAKKPKTKAKSGKIQQKSKVPSKKDVPSKTTRSKAPPKRKPRRKPTRTK